MLAIRLQRVGRKGYPAYRVAVQEAQRHPTSGRVVAYVGNYNPHTKAVKFDKEKIELYLKNGAQPSPRVVKLMSEQKISLPDWVVKQGKKDKKLRNPDKLRKNQPAKPADEPAAEAETEIKDEAAQPNASVEADGAAAAEESAVTPTADEPVAEKAETPAEVEAPAEEASEAPAEEVAVEPETKSEPEEVAVEETEEEPKEKA